MKKTQSSLNDLTPDGRKLHDKLKKEWNIRDTAGSLTLLTLCQAWDRLREAQTILKRDGILSVDRWGQRKPHPASTIEREARAGLLQCLKHLNLDLESLGGDDATEA